jgi:hypothetical protein
MNFMNLLNTAISTKMENSATLITELGGTAIYYLQAPDNTPLPYVVWNWQGAVDENLTPSRMFNNIANIRVFADFSANPQQAGNIDAIIDDLFRGATLSVTGWSNFWTSREFVFGEVSTEINGEKIEVVGGLYRIRIGQ